MALSDTTTNSSNVPVEYYERKLLETLEPRLNVAQLGKKQIIPAKNSDNVKWLRYDAIDGGDPSGTAAQQHLLTEGTVPSSTSFVTSNVSATTKQYGAFSKISDLLQFQSIDDVMSNLAERYGRTGAKTIERIVIAELGSAAAEQIAGAGPAATNIAAGDVMSHLELIEAMISQKRAQIGPHESGKYVSVLNPVAEFDLLADSQGGSFLDINKQSQKADKLLNGEVGQMYGMRFVVSDEMSDLDVADGGSGAVDLFSSFVIGSEAFGTVWLGPGSVSMKVKKAGSAGTSDPLDQFSTIGYKINGYAAKYLDASSKRCIEIKHASALGVNV